MKKMTSKERVMAALNRKPFDRMPVHHEGTPEIDEMLMRHFGINSDEQLRLMLGDDMRYILPKYIGPELKKFPDGSIEGYWGERYAYAQFEGGKYLESVYRPFEGIDELEDLDRSHFPSADWFDYSGIEAECDKLAKRGLAVCAGSAGDMDFINGTARTRGTEDVLIDLGTENPVYLEIMNHRFKFYYEMHERILKAANGKIDIMHIGDDLGTQIAQLISDQCFDKLFAPKYKKYFAMVHSYGAKTMMHMCGCVRAFIPRLVDLGLDIYDVVQPTTPETKIEVLKKDFGDKINFCGSVCVQSTIAFGTVKDVEDEVKKRLELFKDGGLILGPSHAIQVGSPLENVLALYRTAGSLRAEVDDEVKSFAADKMHERVIDMSKMF